MKYLLALGLLGTAIACEYFLYHTSHILQSLKRLQTRHLQAVASHSIHIALAQTHCTTTNNALQTAPHALPVPQSQQEIDPTPSLTYSLRDPEVTDFQTQNGTDSSPTATASSESSATQSTDSPTITEIAAFTVPNGGIYTATAIGGTAQIAGRVLTVGGPDALVGGVRVSAAEDGFKFGDRTAAYKSLTASSTVEAVSSTEAASSSATASSAESSATESASATESGDEEASSTSGSESASASESSSATGGAAGGATAMSKAAFTALGGLAVLLCVFA
jgi:hypothetical protein